MPGVPVELPQPGGAQLRRQLAANQVIDPYPGQRSKRNLQRAGPIDSAMKRVCCKPTFELRADLGQVCLVAREQIRLRQDYEMLMTVQLPNHFVVARTAGIKIRNPPEITESCLNSANMIAPPRHLRSGINREAENREVMTADLFGQA